MNFEEIKEAAYMPLLCFGLIVSIGIYIWGTFKSGKRAYERSKKIRQEQIRKAQEKVKGE